MKFLPSAVQKLSSEQTDRQMDRQTDRWTDRQTDTHTHTQTDTQTQLKLLPTAYADGNDVTDNYRSFILSSRNAKLYVFRKNSTVISLTSFENKVYKNAFQ